jgi:hypothetical protein
MVSGDPQAFKPLYQALLDQYFSAAKLADADKAVFRKLMDDSFRLAGKNLAWSFDLQLDPGLSAMNPDQVMANLDKAFGLSLVMVQDLADAEGYKKFLKDNVGGGILKKYLDTVMAETGFQMDIKLEDKKDGDLAYQEMSFSLAVGDPDKLSMTSDEARAAATVTASLMQKMAMVLGAKGNRLYVVMGDNGLEKLKKVIADDRVEKPLSAMPVWSEWVKTIPGDAQYAGHLSVSRLADLVNVFADNSLKLEVPEADRSGLNSWIQIKDAHITGSASWNIKEMGPVVKASIDFAMAMFSRNAFSGAGGSDSGFSEGDSEPDGDPAAAGGE